MVPGVTLYRLTPKWSKPSGQVFDVTWEAMDDPSDIGWWNPVEPAKLTIPSVYAESHWIVTYQHVWGMNANGGRDSGLYPNGLNNNDIARVHTKPHPTFNDIAGATALRWRAGPGDFLKLALRQTSGVPLDLFGARSNTWVTIALLG